MGRMKDGLIQRGKNRRTAVVTLGYSEPDPVTGTRRILQRWISLGKCSRLEAKKRREELQVAIRKDEFVAPLKLTTGGDERERDGRRTRDSHHDREARPAAR